MLNLTMVGISWPPETFLQRLIQGMLAKDISITIATSNSNLVTGKLGAGNQHLLWAPSWNISNAHRLWNSVKLMRYLPSWTLARVKPMVKIVKQIDNWPDRLRISYLHFPYAAVQPDLVYFPWIFAADHFLDWFASRDIPIVVSLRGSMINVEPHIPDRMKKVRMSLRRIFESAAAVHCVSQAVLEEAIELGLDPAKACVIRPAVEPEFFFPTSNTAEDKRRFHVISIGSLIWRKGWEYALLAIRQMKDAGILVFFEIIGAGADRSRLLYTINDLCLQDCVLLTGHLSAEQIRDHLQQADAFLLSSLSEGIANVVLEAMACGLPIVTTDCGGMREVITDGVEGFLVPIRDPVAMADALMKLQRDPGLRAQIGKRGRKRVETDFSLDHQVDAFLAMFNRVLGSHVQ